MSRILLSIFLVILFGFAKAQTLNKAAKNAFLVTRMVEKFHLKPKPLNDELSSYIFDETLRNLDDQKIFFTQQDINALSQYRLQIDDEIKNKQAGFVTAVTNIFQERVMQADTMIDAACKQPFKFDLPEKYTVAEDTMYAADVKGMKVKITKLIKASVLNTIIAYYDHLSTLKPLQQKKFIDSIEPIIRKKLQVRVKRSFKTMMQSPGGITEAVGDVYCRSIALCYDPHTAFFPPTEKENFSSELGDKPMEFGFAMDEDEDGNVTIDDLKPGSPAFQSGQLNKGDKIIAVRWEGKDSIDVSDANREEVARILAASNKEKIILTVKKLDGNTKQVILRKEKASDNDEEDKVNSFVLKGTKNIGFISLPAFYTDWENGENNVNGCANDVAKAIIKLKKENIEGLIIDLRYNGGGSVQEAIELAGIFIDGGPVAQIKGSDPTKVYTLKDGNRGTIYDGPLMLMINGYSASASEMLAGTLQDYNRAVIVGSSTFGKATMQVVLPMDTTISLQNDNSKNQADSYIKVTTGKLYRVNGTTAQFNGVQPDIALPDLLELNKKENSLAYALAATPIPPNKYYTAYSPLEKGSLSTFAKTFIDTAGYFKNLAKYISQENAENKKKDISLRFVDAFAAYKKGKETAIDFPESTYLPNFTIADLNFDNQRFQNDMDLKEMNEEWKKNIETDIYIQIAYQLITLMR